MTSQNLTGKQRKSKDFTEIDELKKCISHNLWEEKITRGHFTRRRQIKPGGRHEIHEAVTSTGNKKLGKFTVEPNVLIDCFNVNCRLGIWIERESRTQLK